MAVESVMQRAFLAGELSPAAAARADLAKYTSGLRTCRNFLVLKHGGVTKRPGLHYVAETKGSQPVKLLAFIFEADDQTYLLEFGDHYLRFFWHGAPVVDPGTGLPLELGTPWTGADVAALRATQSADVVTLTHPDHPVQELQRQAHTTWVLTPAVFTPTIPPPAGIIVAYSGTGTYKPTYVVTAVKAETYEESLPSAPATAAGAPLPTPTTPIGVSRLAPVAGAVLYNVYCDPYGNGIYGFLGSFSEEKPGFQDVGFLPDYTISPPVAQNVFNAPGDYPAIARYFQQRIWYASSRNQPEKVWGSRVGSFHNFNISTPLQDDDAVDFVLAQQYLSPVVDLLAMKQLLVFTDTGEWRIVGDANSTVTPTAINAEPEAYAGASAVVRPIPIGRLVLYVQARGTIVRELHYDLYAQGFVTRDVTLFSAHLFGASSPGDTGKVFSLIDMAWQQQPNMVLWVVRNDGVLLGMTYVPDEQVEGWHRHDTDGVVENCLVLPNTTIGEDELYVVVARTIQGVTRRYIERLGRAQVDTPSDWFFVDAGLTYTGPPASTFSGLDHLEGKVVAVLGDGQVVFNGDPSDPRASQFTVTGGAIADLGQTYSVVQAGLPIRFAELQLLDLDVQGSALRSKYKRVAGLDLLIDASSPVFFAGPDRDHLLPHRLEPWQLAQVTTTGLLELNMTSTFAKQFGGWIRHVDPTPFTVLAALPLLEVGG